MTAPSRQFRIEGLHALYERAPDAMLLADDLGKLIDGNPAALELIGCSTEELKKKHVWELGAGPFEDETAVRSAWQQFLQDGTQEGEFPLRRCDGATVVTEYRAVAHVVPGVHLSILRNVTERKKQEEALSKAYDSLKSADDRRRSLFSLVSHDIRSPISAIIGGAELIIREASNERQVRFGSVIKRSAAQLNRLAQDLLTLAELQSGELDVRKESLDLREILQNAAEAARTSLENSALSLVLETPATPIRIDADGDRLLQVFTNVLSNAGRFATAEVHVHAEARSELVTIRISDDGPGIPEGKTKAIFDPFVGADRRGLSQTGLGLWIARSLLGAHGGNILAENRAQGGASFVITLPGSESSARATAGA